VTKDTIIKADRKANIVLSQTKKLSLKEWDKFESLIMQCHFWAMKPIDRQLGCDGAEWIIEAHLKGRYFFVNRWSPDKSNYSNCGKYLIELSGQKYEIY
jgi:hypothetical protein